MVPVVAPIKAICWVVLVATLAELLGCEGQPVRPEPVKDLFALLAEQGFEPNVGLSAVFAPGNIVQTQTQGPGGAQALVTPLVFAWGTDCFPGQVPQRSPFALPQSSGYQASGFRLGAQLLGELLPSLHFDRATVMQYQLELGNTEILTYAKADLSRQLAEPCVRALAQAMDDGDRIEWYAVVIEAVVTDSLELSIDWQSSASASARTAAVGSARQQLAGMMATGARGALPIDAAVGVVSNAANRSLLRARGPVVVGYRVRPLQPVYGD